MDYVIEKCVNELETIASILKRYNKDDDYWHPVYGLYDGTLDIPHKDLHTYVLVRVREIHIVGEKKVEGNILSVPQIAKFDHDNFVWIRDNGHQYGTEECPFDVIFWRALPNMVGV